MYTIQMNLQKTTAKSRKLKLLVQKYYKKQNRTVCSSPQHTEDSASVTAWLPASLNHNGLLAMEFKVTEKGNVFMW